MRATPRVVVAGGSPLERSVHVRVLVRAGLAASAAATWPELLAACDTSAVDVVVCPTRLGEQELGDVLGEVLTAGVRVLVLCEESAVGRVPDLLLAGASGYLSTADCSAGQLVDAVRSVAAGEAALHPAVATALLSQWRALRSADPADREVVLTAQERRVLAEMVAGAPTKTIARTLGVSPKTVESHSSRLYAKLGARSRAQAVQIALDRRLVSANH